MKLFHFVVVSTLSLMNVGCQSLRDSTLVGTGVGSLIGGAFGGVAAAQQGRAGEGMAVGSVVGAAVGGLSGFFWHKEQQTRQSADENRDDRAPIPRLSKAKVRRIWIPDRIEGDRLVKGHFIYEIAQPSSWSVGNGNK